jgi:hypothetical protein
VEIHTLAAPPAAHNVDDELVKVKVETRHDFARKYQLTLPPCSVIVLVNNAR